MRDHVHCRSHRDHELGPSNAGAPLCNINALKHGRYSKRQKSDKLRLMAYQIVNDPDHLPQHVSQTVNEIHAKSPGPVITLLFLKKLLAPLVHVVAEIQFTTELDAFLETVSSHNQPALKSHLWKTTIRLAPVERLAVLRTVLKEISNHIMDGAYGEQS